MEKLFWPALNLIGLLGFLAYKTKGPFFSFISGRRSEIYAGLNRSKVQLQEASKKRAEVEAKLSRLQDETKEIANEWAHKSLAQTEVIKQSSARVIAQMRSEAEQNKAALIEQTRGAIRASFRKSILIAAEQKIAQALNPALHAKANEQILAEIVKGEMHQ